ncbi:MAG: CBS domain-containing protein [Rhodospirillaceae bacterium]|nr:CBS domain-containing protein [Rhodospirillaceae bacterium]
MIVKTILDSKDGGVITTDADASLVDVARMFKEMGIGFAAVVENDKTIGSISERDIINALVKNDGNVSALKVRDVASANVISCNIDALTTELSDLMTNKRTRHVLVMDKGKLAGIISIGDLIKHSLDECQIDSGAMREYISGQGYM